MASALVVRADPVDLPACGSGCSPGRRLGASPPREGEPQWILDLRLKALKLFRRKPMPAWGADLTGIDFENIKYFVRSTEKQAASWDDLPADIKSTYDKLA